LKASLSISLVTAGSDAVAAAINIDIRNKENSHVIIHDNNSNK
jgi:hypothetical protein